MVKRLLLVVAGVLFLSTTAYATEPEESDNPYRFIEITDEEADLLNRITAAEAQTQNMPGRRAVVEVILNRVISPDWPNTVKGVLSQPGQFSSWKHRYDSWVVPELGCDAVNEILSIGPMELPNTDYVFFSRGRSKYATDYIKIQDHWFGRRK